MKTTVYLKGKKITQKKAKEIMGEERFKLRIKESKETFANDPNTLIEFMDGMRIVFN